MASNKNTLKEIFKRFDKDKSGAIDMPELKAALRAAYLALGIPADEQKVIQRAKVWSATIIWF